MAAFKDEFIDHCVEMIREIGKILGHYARDNKPASTEQFTPEIQKLIEEDLDRSQRGLPGAN